MTKFKHFETESGNKVTTAEFDGYSIAERLLEGLMFQITIQPDGTLKASVKPSDEGYFSQFNTSKFLKEAEEYAVECDEFTDPLSGEACWLVVDGQDNRPKRTGIPIAISKHPFQSPTTQSPTVETEDEETKEVIIGDFKPKRKFLNFVSASNRAKVRYIRDIAFLKGEKLSGVLEGVVFKITICDEGTIKFEEVDTNQTDVAQRQRLLDDIDSMDVTGYAQKFVIGELEFSDVNGDRCYLEVEHQKPIDKFASLLDMFNEEKKEVEKATLSDKGMSLLDSLFGDDTEIPESNEDLELTENDVKTIIEANENAPEPNEKLKNAASSYMEEQFRKMNEDKINELKERISKKEEEVMKYNRDKSFAETKLDQTKEELGILQTRLESMTPGDEPNGFAFYVSEEQKSETGLDESTRHIADKIADLMKLKKDVLFEHLTSGYYTIKIAPKDDFENLDIDKDILTKVASIDILGNLTMVDKGTFEYRGELNWHQLVGKMIRNGFEQVPEFDQHCSSNSYESHEEDPVEGVTDSTQDMGTLDGKVVKIRTSWEGTGDSPWTYIVKMDYSKLSKSSIDVIENMTILDDGITLYNKTNVYNLSDEIESLQQMPKDSTFDLEIEIEFES